VRRPPPFDCAERAVGGVADAPSLPAEDGEYDVLM
jgi:hypothetical protein